MPALPFQIDLKWLQHPRIWPWSPVQSAPPTLCLHMIGNLQSLECLDLSNNQLSGEIPWCLSNLTSESYLNLSYNNLSGRQEFKQ
uniref:Uncharacterized protein n=1 Tax=Arundo donax TaxID=35708 RepID=A0A0A9AJH8_ARUDO